MSHNGPLLLKSFNGWSNLLFMKNGTSCLLSNSFLMTLMNYRNIFLMNELFFCFMNNWLNFFMNMFFKNNRLNMFMNYRLMVLMNNILVLFPDNLLMLFLKDICMMFFNNRPLNYLLNNWSLLMSDDFCLWCMNSNFGCPLMSDNFLSDVMSSLDNRFSSYLCSGQSFSS